MARHPTLRSDRLLLRPWRDADREPFAALNVDPVVMEHFRRRSTEPPPTPWPAALPNISTATAGACGRSKCRA